MTRRKLRMGLLVVVLSASSLFAWACGTLVGADVGAGTGAAIGAGVGAAADVIYV
jgi:hypothetical protein